MENGAAAAEDAAAPSNLTLYVSNLPEKFKPEDMQQSMRAIFGQFGEVLDVVYRRTYRLRGQAWVVFGAAADAARAAEAMQGFPFFGKPLRIGFARVASDAAKVAAGTFDEAAAEARREARREANRQRAAAAAAAAAPAPAAAAPAAAAAPPAAARTLLVENLPPGTNEGMLGMLFQQFPGFAAVRLAAGGGAATVEYGDAAGAAAAAAGLQGFRLATDKPMRISVAPPAR